MSEVDMKSIGSGASRVDALLLHSDDDVAMALHDIAAGAHCRVQSPDGERFIEVGEAIPFGHKFAVRDISAGAVVRKYGETIGSARRAIAVGAHVHTHNLASLRAQKATASEAS